MGHEGRYKMLGHFVLFFSLFFSFGGWGRSKRKDSFRVVSFDCFNSCCAEEICKTKAEINTKKLRKKLGMTSRQRGIGKVGKLLLKGGPK